MAPFMNPSSLLPPKAGKNTGGFHTGFSSDNESWSSVNYNGTRARILAYVVVAGAFVMGW